jgi:hypothetical protein
MHLEEVLRTYDPTRDQGAQFRFGTDSRASATIYLAEISWHLGDIKRGCELCEQAAARALDTAHPATLANTLALDSILNPIAVTPKVPSTSQMPWRISAERMVYPSIPDLRLCIRPGPELSSGITRLP